MFKYDRKKDTLGELLTNLENRCLLQGNEIVMKKHSDPATYADLRKMHAALSETVTLIRGIIEWIEAVDASKQSTIGNVR